MVLQLLALPSLGYGGCVFPELSKTTLLEEMRTTMVARSQVLELEEKVQVLTGQRDSLEQKLSATSVQLEKEKVRVESMFRHEEVRPAPEHWERLSCCPVSGLWGMGATVPYTLSLHPQSLQAKQRALLQQLDSLDQEREELQASLGEAEEDKAQLAEQLQQSQEQSGKQLQAQQVSTGTRAWDTACATGLSGATHCLVPHPQPEFFQEGCSGAQGDIATWPCPHGIPREEPSPSTLRQTSRCVS